MKLKEWLKKYFSEEAEIDDLADKSEIHIEKTEKDMKEWYYSDFPLCEVIEKIEEKFKAWNYIDELNIWVFVYGDY